MKYLTVGEAAHKLAANPKHISDLFYIRVLSVERCPLMGGRRMIPESYLETIRSALKESGKPVDGGAGVFHE